MDGLLSFLIFAGIFYFMMRFGCGAHKVHGNDNHDTDKTDNNPDHIDPVCGMKVDTDKGYGMMFDGSLYRFCSRTCLDKFEVNPKKILQSHQQGEKVCSSVPGISFFKNAGPIPKNRTSFL